MQKIKKAKGRDGGRSQLSPAARFDVLCRPSCRELYLVHSPGASVEAYRTKAEEAIANREVSSRVNKKSSKLNNSVGSFLKRGS